ncbi:WD40-repeat-containing domain protein [Roridomyces roridus]|uniref:WD40-repeat-containing domain protein n=1 Tax=Roridomyces roridus TaxID=1738132 RepID=A0AAD7B1Q6_9AGAR|nr:WD40-repeat-containing domain protein [Roridomyces roridus]
MPLACSAQNVIYYGRATNRVFSRDMIAGDLPKQFCKVKAEHGGLKLLVAGDRRLAFSTTTGCIQIWDTETKTMLTSWTNKNKKKLGGAGVACMAWFGPFLAVGWAHGAIRVYDTRIGNVAKMKERCTRMFRHEAAICALQWNSNGKMLASGDESGRVLCWDMAASTRAQHQSPLEVGDHVQRRKKIVHSGTIMALAWCPWNPKLLATGDASGTLKLWTIEANTTHTNAGAKVDLGSRITSLHFSPHYKELVCALGERVTTDAVPGMGSKHAALSNEVVVYQVPGLRHITNVPVSGQVGGGTVEGAVLSTGSGTHRLVVAVPSEDKLKVYEVWGKQKELRRQQSFVDGTTCLIR